MKAAGEDVELGTLVPRDEEKKRSKSFYELGQEMAASVRAVPYQYNMSDLSANYAVMQQSTELELNERSIVIANANLRNRSLSNGRSGSATEKSLGGLFLTDEGLEELARDPHVVVDHMLPLETLMKKLDTDATKGLSVDRIAAIRQHYGANTIAPPPKPWMILVFAKLLVTGFNLILWIAAILFVLCYKPFGEPNPLIVNLAIAVLIVLVILFNVMFNFYQERKSMKIVASFRDVLPQKCTVVRDGIEQQMMATQLVPGDIVLLRSGEKVPADCRLLECSGLKVNNSALTGESLPVSCSVKCTNKNFMESANYVFSSAHITEGSGRAVCCKIGDHTVIGQVSLLANKGSSTKTSLHVEIQRFVNMIVVLALTTAIIAIIGYFAFLQTQHPSYMPWVAMVANVLSLVVAYVPEGLPMCVTITLTVIAQRMYRQNVLVKSLGTLHTFNSVNLVCSDKTGTLTTGKMSVTNFMYGRNAATCWNAMAANNKPDNGVVSSMLLACALCNDAKVTSNPGKPVSFIGDPVDIALYQLLQEIELPMETTCSKFPRLSSLPFNSRYKMMITLSKEHSKSFIACLKGAPESVLPRCSHLQCEDGTTTPINADIISALNEQQRALGGAGYRVIAIARQDFGAIPPTSSDEEELNGLPSEGYCFLGFVSLLDPPRPQVPRAVVKMKHAGIRVAMVTGDHQTTARTIACKVSIFSPKIGATNLSTCQVAQDNLGRAVLELYFNGRKLATHLHGSTNFITPDDRVLASVEELMALAGIVPNYQSTTVHKITNKMQPEVKSSESDMRVRSNNGTLYTGGVIVSGTELALFDECMWDWCLAHQELVFARTTPEQKLKIVKSAQKREEIVVVTGDGVNDAPALRAANLGVAMQSGTEVSRESAHMVLLDNSFSSLMEAVETGRLVSENLKKVCIYLLPAGSWSEMTPVMANVFLGVPLPLSTFLMIVVCMFTDVFPSLALVYEKAESDLMSRPPATKKNSNGRLVNLPLILHAYGFIGCLETFAAFTCWFWYFHDMGFAPSDVLLAYENFGSTGDARYMAMSPDDRTAYLTEVVNTGQSIFFVALVMLQFFNLLATRTRYVSIWEHNPLWGPTRNLKLPLAIIMSTVVAVIVTQVPWFNDVFQTRPVPAKYVMPALGFGFGLFLLDESRKFLVKKYPHSCLAKIAW